MSPSRTPRLARAVAATGSTLLLVLGLPGLATAQPAPTPTATPVEQPAPDTSADTPQLPPIPPETSLPAAPMPADAAPPQAQAQARSMNIQTQGEEAWKHRPSADRAKVPAPKKKWEPTKNPNATVQPGTMRSDREEIPEGFTKADADKAEQLEAKLAGGGTDGAARMLVAAGCQVYWPAPYEVCGRIRDKCNALGGPNSFLLFPKTNELTNPDGVGKRTEFQNGPIYWSPQGDAHPVVNHFLAAWARHGYENSYIGYPTTDEIVNPDGIGRRQHFTGSTIYWRLNEAYSVGGAIADRWYQLGAERTDSLLGYPISDELVLPDGQGRMNRFERGVIYWHPTTGAHEVVGLVLSVWSESGYERSPYGYPVEAPSAPKDGFITQRFQNKAISAPVLNPLMQVAQVHYLPFASASAAKDFFDRVEQGLEKLPTGPNGSAANSNELTRTAAGERLGPCVLTVSDVYLRKSFNYESLGFKPLTRCESEVMSVSHTSDLRYEYYNHWNTSANITSVTDYPEKEPPTSGDRSKGFISRYETKTLQQPCDGSVDTWVAGSTSGTISDASGSYYARAYSPHIRQLPCRVH